MNIPPWLHVDREEIANSLTHGLGALLSLTGLIVLLTLAVLYGNALHILSATVFGGSLVFLYTASTLYHGIRVPRIKELFRLLDHVGIYLLIAGSYTPFTLLTLRGGLGWTLFATVWAMALAGIAYKIFSRRKYPWFSTVYYLLMGWLAVFFLKPIAASLPSEGLMMLIAGGLSYTAGVIFYAWKRLPFNHAIWHLFVLAGSALHFMTVALYVFPR
jgi:hemolysin III